LLELFYLISLGLETAKLPHSPKLAVTTWE